MKKELITSMKTIYDLLWTILASYDQRDSYDALDIVRKEIHTLFLYHEELRLQLNTILDETIEFLDCHEVPGVVLRWKRINPQILFFDCAFDLLEECPDMVQIMRWGLTDLKLSCYPDDVLIEARKQYFAALKKSAQEKHLDYSEEQGFLGELLHTLTLVFAHDFPFIFP